MKVVLKSPSKVQYSSAAAMFKLCRVNILSLTACTLEWCLPMFRVKT
jgi:hypothetical protein